MSKRKELARLIASLEHSIPVLERRLTEARASQPDTPEISAALHGAAVKLARCKQDLADLRAQAESLRDSRRPPVSAKRLRLS